MFQEKREARTQVKHTVLNQISGCRGPLILTKQTTYTQEANRTYHKPHHYIVTTNIYSLHPPHQNSSPVAC